MSRTTMKELRQMGVPTEDIELAKITQAAQRRNGSPVQSIGVLVGATEPRQRHNPNPPASLTDRAMRRRGTYDQAALLLDQQALQESSPERAARAREAAKAAKELSAVDQIEFDFFGGGNVSISFQYHDAVTERLFERARTTAQAKEAVSVLWVISRHMNWELHECTKSAKELCEITHTKAPNMANALKLLEEVGAIQRVQNGRSKTIMINPEGVYRGNVNNHGKGVERYRTARQKAEAKNYTVVDGGKD